MKQRLRDSERWGEEEKEKAAKGFKSFPWLHAGVLVVFLITKRPTDRPLEVGVLADRVDGPPRLSSRVAPFLSPRLVAVVVIVGGKEKEKG